MLHITPEADRALIVAAIQRKLDQLTDDALLLVSVQDEGWERPALRAEIDR